MGEHTGYLRFQRELAKFARSSSFGIVGEESFFKRDAVYALMQHWRGTMPLDEEFFDGSDKYTKLNRINESIAEYPLVGKFRVVVVENVDKVKDFKKLNEWLTEPPLETKLVLHFSDEITEIPKDLAFACAVVCNDMGVGSKEYDKYIDYCLESKHKQLHPDARAYVKSVFGEQVHRIKSELVKAAFFVGDRQEITQVDLQQILSVQATSRVFDLVDLVVKRDLINSMRMLTDLLAGGLEPGGFFTLLTRRLALIENANKAFARGEKLKDYMIRKKIPLFQFGSVLEGTRHLKSYHFAKFYSVLCEAEAELKSWSEKSRVLEKMMVQLCS